MTIDTQTDADTLKTKELMIDIMKDLSSNIHLSNIIFKTGRTSPDTQSDFRKGAIFLFRDHVILLAYKHLVDILCHEQRKAPSTPINITPVLDRLMDEANAQAKKSLASFEHLYSHLRQDHKEEILNVAKSLNINTIEWQDD